MERQQWKIPLTESAASTVLSPLKWNIYFFYFWFILGYWIMNTKGKITNNIY
jgi:hypothetical protein